MRDTVGAVHRSLTMKHMVGLQDNLAVMPLEVTVATACSGTDLVLEVLCALSEFWRANYGVAVELKHVWACDAKLVPQSFLQAVHGFQ